MTVTRYAWIVGSLVAVLMASPAQAQSRGGGAGTADPSGATTTNDAPHPKGTHPSETGTGTGTGAGTGSASSEQAGEKKSRQETGSPQSGSSYTQPSGGVGERAPDDRTESTEGGR